MKTAKDPRHIKRIHIMQDLFAYQFKNNRPPKYEVTKEIIKNLDQINQTITKAAPTWPLDQINKVDLAILRLAIFELIIVKEAPFKVVADEAVELAKEFGSQSSPNFINGVLGNVITAKKLDKEKGKNG